ncbi:YkvA family protein [Marinactinospora rubrisoli]|uniref:YkvA family protein n=1 Tax=Marinactinospora rubrisoli TaxID=2715399 RepID=A0ABW2KAS8_9ACTN
MRKSNRVAAGAAAWKVVQDSSKPGRPGIWERAAAVPRLLGARLRGRYTQLSASKVALFALAAVYILSPIDLVPEFFAPILGLADDVGVAVWLAASLLTETERFMEWEARGPEYVQGNVVS